MFKLFLSMLHRASSVAQRGVLGRWWAAPLCSRRCYHGQHRTPILPQILVQQEEPAALPTIQVGYLLHRPQVVKHSPHPLEVEMSYVLEREHQRYSRHEGSESATHFLATRGQSMDLLGRSDTNQIRGNFYGLELYQDAMKVVLQRYHPEKRLKEADFWKPSELSDVLPQRHTLQRKLDDVLYLILLDAETGKWGIPYAERKPTETLRMTVDRAVSTHHEDGLESYMWSNAPQATVADAQNNTRLFIYSATYLSGRPRFDTMKPSPKDHAWVTRHEMLQYADAFQSAELLSALRDISADSTFEA